MTRLDLVNLLRIAVNRDDLTASYPEFLNQAQREICRMFDWSWMLTNSTITATAGNNYLVMPANFKALARSRSPVHKIDDDGDLVPVDITFKGSRVRWSALYPLAVTKRLRCYPDFSNTPPRLNFYDTFDENTDFDVNYFGYLADLSADGSTNALTEQYPLMLLAKAKQLAFETINDAQAQDCVAQFMLKFQGARSFDSHAQVAGQQLRF